MAELYNVFYFLHGLSVSLSQPFDQPGLAKGNNANPVNDDCINVINSPAFVNLLQSVPG